MKARRALKQIMDVDAFRMTTLVEFGARVDELDRM